LALFIFACIFASWVVAPDHVAGNVELGRLDSALAFSVYYGIVAWVFYLGLEPFVRRRWPSVLVSWSRLLAGRVRDPLVGRDVLVGLLFAACFHVLNFTDRLIGGWLGVGPPYLDTTIPEVNGIRRMMAFLLDDGLREILFATMGALLGLVVLRTILRKQWLAVGTLGLILLARYLWRLNEPPYLSLLLNVLMISFLLFCLLRFGLLALTFMAVSARLTDRFTLTTDLSSWYGAETVAIVILIGALALYGFLVSLPPGRRRPYGYPV
jgi:hypothetical protein